MTSQNRAANAEDERRAARLAWDEAVALDRLGHHGGAVSRAYYAAFHAARALLLEKGLEPKTHEGVRRMLALHYVLPGLLHQQHGDALSRLATLRELSDYAPVEPMSAQVAHEALEAAKPLLSAARVSLD